MCVKHNEKNTADECLLCNTEHNRYGWTKPDEGIHIVENYFYTRLIVLFLLFDAQKPILSGFVIVPSVF